MNFSFRLGNMEVRSCGEHLMQNKEHDTAEIIYWYDDEFEKYCYVIAYWVKDNEGYDLQFVGSRPLSHFDQWNDFGKLIKVGQKELDLLFEKM